MYLFYLNVNNYWYRVFDNIIFLLVFLKSAVSLVLTHLGTLQFCWGLCLERHPWNLHSQLWFPPTKGSGMWLNQSSLPHPRPYWPPCAPEVQVLLLLPRIFSSSAVTPGVKVCKKRDRMRETGPPVTEPLRFPFHSPTDSSLLGFPGSSLIFLPLLVF